MGRGKEIDGPVRNDNPCRNCTERFIACADHCPKDERGEFGHKAWIAKLEEIKEELKLTDDDLEQIISNHFGW